MSPSFPRTYSLIKKISHGVDLENGNRKVIYRTKQEYGARRCATCAGTIMSCNGGMRTDNCSTVSEYCTSQWWTVLQLLYDTA